MASDIKKLEKMKKEATSPHLKAQIQKKIDALKGNKEILK